MPQYFTLIAPLAAGLAVGASVWLLVAAGRGERVGEGEGKAQAAVKACDHCGSRVLDDWRLCPECGGFIGDAEIGQAAVPAGVHLSEQRSKRSGLG